MNLCDTCIQSCYSTEPVTECQSYTSQKKTAYKVFPQVFTVPKREKYKPGEPLQERIVEVLRLAHFSTYEIAKGLHVSQSTVFRIVQKTKRPQE